MFDASATEKKQHVLFTTATTKNFESLTFFLNKCRIDTKAADFFSFLNTSQDVQLTDCRFLYSNASLCLLDICSFCLLIRPEEELTVSQ